MLHTYIMYNAYIYIYILHYIIHHILKWHRPQGAPAARPPCARPAPSGPTRCQVSMMWFFFGRSEPTKMGKTMDFMICLWYLWYFMIFCDILWRLHGHMMGRLKQQFKILVIFGCVWIWIVFRKLMIKRCFQARIGDPMWPFKLLIIIGTEKIYPWIHGYLNLYRYPDMASHGHFCDHRVVQAEVQVVYNSMRDVLVSTHSCGRFQFYIPYLIPTST